MLNHLLEVKNLNIVFKKNDNYINAVTDVSYQINAGEIVGLVGESGCGKTVSAMAILGLLPKINCNITGKIFFDSNDLLQMDNHEIRKIRGSKISMIFQEPTTFLNPVLTVGKQISESLILHLKINASSAKEETIKLLNLVGIKGAENRFNNYPHQFSGGMRQRIMIAMALSCKPRLIIADEPTTALDVTIQHQILELISQLSKQYGVSIILITHNLGIVARYADRVIVMYSGSIVETGDVDDIFYHSKHPYTRSLLNTIPRIDSTDYNSMLSVIEGQPPDQFNLPNGCNFAERCKYVTKECSSSKPDLKLAGNSHSFACWNSL